MRACPVKALVTIVDRGRGANLGAFLNKKYAQISFVLMGRGTASSDILDMLGIGSSDKDIVLTLADAQALPELMNELSGRRLIRFSSRGISFTIPISAISALLQGALTGQRPADETKEETMASTTYPYSLILVAAQRGYTEEIMRLARGAGATGGTILHARGIGHGEAEHFLGITLLDEKEIVAILAPAQDKTAIARAINEAFGVRTEAQALVLTLPVEEMTQVNG